MLLAGIKTMVKIDIQYQKVTKKAKHLVKAAGHDYIIVGGRM